jgi:serine protease
MSVSRLAFSLFIFSVFSVAASVLSGERVLGQAPVLSRLLLDRFAPPPIERGISPLQLRAPGSADAIRRRSIRREGAPVDRVGTSGARYLPGRVIVKFKGGTSVAERISALSTASRTASMSRQPSYADFDVIQIDPNEDAESIAKIFAERDDVEYAQAAYRVYPFLKPNDTLYSQQWNLPLIDMERAWDIQPMAGSTITVAVLDTGVAYTSATLRFHANAFRIDGENNVDPPDGSGTLYPALGDLTLSFVPATQLASTGRFVAPHDFIWDDDLPVDLDGHGTHVSGTIGQLTNDSVGTAGVAFNVKLMPIKVVNGVWDDIFASPNFGSDDVVARGIRYAADNGAKVLNMSIGRTGPPAPVVEAAIRYAVGRGAFVVISAGNEFEEGNPTEVIAEIASRVNGAVAVAAVDRAKAHAYYSSSGSYVELAAPGGSFRGFSNAGGVLQQTLDLDLVDTYDDAPSRFGAPRFDVLAYFFFTGTSQAAPHVAGLGAMLMQQGITDPAAVESALEKFATDLGDPGRDPLFGFGLVHARNTLRGLGLSK